MSDLVPGGLRGLTDCHAHLGDPVFDTDRSATLERARAVGVERVVVVGETLADGQRHLELQGRHPEIRVCAGLYPTYLDLDQAEEVIEWIRVHRDSLIGIGEVGLDRWKVREEVDLALQRQIFARFIDLSLELDLPLNVHSRSAGRQVIELLIERGARRVQLHAFDGRAAKARPALDAGFYFSIPAEVLRSPQKQKLVRQLPLDRVLLETDSPVLAVQRGQRNEPAAARTALEAIADLKQLSVEEVAAATRDNAAVLYGPGLYADGAGRSGEGIEAVGDP